MANYSMYYDYLTDVAKWKEYEEKRKKAKKNKEEFNEIAPKECKPLVFGRKNIPDDKFKLEELDALTSSYESQEQFVYHLKRINNEYYKKLTENNRRLIIIYKSSGELKKKDVIYNNILLKKCALQVIDERKKGTKDSDIVLKLIPELDQFIEKIKAYALNSEFLQKMKSSDLVDYKLKEYLEEYAEIDELGIETDDEKYNLDVIKKKITKKLREYKTLRKMLIWEEKYIKHQQKNDGQLEFEIDEEKISKEQVTSVYNVDDLFEDDNNELNRLYRQGGIDAIMASMDLDEVMSYSKEQLESVGLGYLKKNDEENANTGKVK